MKNKLTDLNDYLFAQLERLSDEELQGEELNLEIQRAKSIADIATNIVGVAKVQVDAMKLIGRGEITKNEISSFITQKQIQG